MPKNMSAMNSAGRNSHGVLARTRRVGVAGLAVIAIALSACSDSTGPRAPVPVLFDGSQLAVLVAGESMRVIQSLPDVPQRNQLHWSLKKLSDALDAGSVKESRAALGDCSASLTQLQSVYMGDDNALADLEALSLAIEIVQNALPMTTA